MIEVMVVDDSALVRERIKAILGETPDIRVTMTAADPFLAAEQMRNAVPDVMILDIEMPRMDGLTFLKKLMNQHPLPVIICSSLTGEGSDLVLRALEYGAIEVLHKPSLGVGEFLQESSILLADLVRAAAATNRKSKPTPAADVGQLGNLAFPFSPPSTSGEQRLRSRVIVIGASTGGTEAIRTLLQAMPVNCPGMVIVQHMPEYFTKAFAMQLNEHCEAFVKEAESHDWVRPGEVLIAPGNQHLLLKRIGIHYRIELKAGPLVSRHRPSVDVLFRSAARYAGKDAIGVILTGMGDDGAKGMKAMAEAGAFNIAQSEESCVVFGMPQAAIQQGGVHQVAPLSAIPAAILAKCL